MSEVYSELREWARIEDDFYRWYNTPKRWNIIREIYKIMMPDIIEASKRDIRAWSDPYFVDWSKVFTPIESSAWQSIRYYGCPLYPQLPVLNYFIDFANPYLKIALELDGKDFHDAKKDRVRDKNLAREGWRIYRVAGSECFKRTRTYEALSEADSIYKSEHGHYSSKLYDEISEYFLESSDGVILAIDLIHFNGGESLRFLSMARMTLDIHSSL